MFYRSMALSIKNVIMTEKITSVMIPWPPAPGNQQICIVYAAQRSLSGAELEIVRDNHINTVAADALVPCATSPPAPMHGNEYIRPNLVPAETGIFRDNKINTMASHALVPCVARSSEPIVLIIQRKLVFGFHTEGFQLPVFRYRMQDDIAIRGHHKMRFCYIEENKSAMVSLCRWVLPKIWKI